MKLPALILAGTLLARISAWGDIVINEIVSQNSLDGFAAADGNTYDWIELYNNGPEEVDLQGTYLTDDKTTPTKWQFARSFPIPAGGFAVVFASDLDGLIERQEHLNFKLDSGDGEYLALVANDGETILDDFDPAFPPLGTNHSFGNPEGEAEPVILLSPTPGTTNTTAAPLPKINAFKSTKTVIANGESITVSWESENSETLTLKTSSSQNTTVDPNGSVILRPTYHQTITLTARNGYARTSQTIEILVGPAVTDFSASPAIIANGGETVLRWETIGSDRTVALNQFPFTTISPPIQFTPTNLSLVSSDETWKQAPTVPDEGWQNIGYDDSDWSDIVPPFEGSHYYRKIFQVSDPGSLAIGALQIARAYNFHVTINGQTIFTSGTPNGTPGSLNGTFRFDPALLREGENVIAATLSAPIGEYNIKLDAWRSQPIDTVVPVTLLVSNEAGEESKTVDVTVLAKTTPLPPLPTIAISEIFWSYFGTLPVEPYRFFEFQNCGAQPVDLSEIQLVGDSYFSFTDATETTLDPGSVAIVVTHHPTFSEIWPGDRNVIGQVEDPQQAETYQFDFEIALLDTFGRSFEKVGSHSLPQFGDFLQTFERADPKASSLDPSNWFVARELGNGNGGGTPGELPFRIIDFSFDPPFASPGDSVSLNWEISRPANLSITNDIGPISGTSGSIDLIVPEDARSFRFQLNAETTFTNRDRYATLILPPSISSFTSSKLTITPGEETTFYWGQAIPYIPYQINITPEVLPGIYGGRHTFTPLVSGFPKGSLWRTRAHETPPEADWNAIDFDVQWRNRRASIGFGNDQLATSLPPRNWLTAYFYRSFQVTEVEEVEELLLDLFNDDGIEIFINGQEVLRANLPQGDLDHLTPALAKIAPSERIFAVDPALLVEGENIIAVGIHNSSIDDDNLVFDLGVRAKRKLPDSGQKTYTFTSSNQAGSDSAQITLLFADSVSVTDWQNDQGLIGDSRTSDADGDGLSDFLEFVTGSDPLQLSDDPISVSRDQDGFMTVSYPHNLLSEKNFLSLQFSSDLQTWTNINDFKFEGAVAPEGSHVAQFKYRSYSPVRESRYFRLIAN
ncbi:MAG: lamin tail domain-containing protein [Akkermansiaceae bacterium]